ncbi:dimethylarginine dimethylaminohydrolase family protein [Lacisediminimonas profundi]|uniref:dimethylarginine dimethylaminohydrolase family protein n=1 Tax=Lacisediminimonas profundi TaxID=2603856 RepID=UPI00124AE418|nr:arginine deiminase-related protein [Lacisediminimonas profundi]
MKPRILMCAPDHFDVVYVINPWMEGNVAHCDPALAMRQWQALSRAIGRVATVESILGTEGVPDMVFTANAGLVIGEKAILSHFRHIERQAEEPLFASWFAAHGMQVLRLPDDIYFEGAGDALFDRREPLLWLGWGHRSNLGSAPFLAMWLDVVVQPLRLVDPRFYHLDTCFCPLDGGRLLYYPDAFDAESQRRIAARVPAEFRIAVSTDDAKAFACNAVNVGSHLFMNRASAALVQALEAAGYQVHQTPLSEFMKAGGAAKCLTLRLDERVARSRSHPRLISD